MATIAISGSYGGLNAGDEAILTAVLACLRDAVPGAELVVCSRDPEHTRRSHDADRVVAARELSRDEIIPEIESLDLFVLGGGGILYDTEARLYMRDVRLAQERRIPTFGYALGAGPLDNPEERTVVRDTLNGMDGITLRDEVAKRVLEDVGVEQAMAVTADPAVLLEPEPFSDEMLHSEGIGDGDVLVGMSVREPGRAAPNLDEDGYHLLLAHAADFITQRFDATVVFVPMERDDIRHAHAVIARMVAAERARVLTARLRPGQILGVMERLEFAVGLRLHFLIFAAVAEVPFLALPYAGKVAAFVEALGMPAPAPVTRESAGPLLAEIDQLWDRREERRRAIRRALPDLQERARTDPRLAAELLHGRADGQAVAGAAAR